MNFVIKFANNLMLLRPIKIEIFYMFLGEHYKYSFDACILTRPPKGQNFCILFVMLHNEFLGYPCVGSSSYEWVVHAMHY